MIQTTAGQIERALKTLSFESNIAYVDFESGVLQSKSRSDLLIVLPYLIILLSQLSFRKL
jgi:hypothetical protein